MIWRIITVATFGTIGALLGFWSTDREPPTRFIRTEVLTPVIQPGGELRIRYEVQRLRSCKTHVDRVLFDADRVRRDLDDIDYAAAPGPLGESTFILSINIPRNFAQGVGTYKTIFSYSCNPIQANYPIIVPAETIQFTVKGEPKEDGSAPIEVIPRR